MKIRQADASDLNLLSNWTLSLHRHEDDGELTVHQNFEQNLIRWLGQDIENPASLYLIAENDGKPVGFVAATQVLNDNGLLQQPIKGVIQLLWVEPDYRHAGIAGELLTHIEACLKNCGINYVECTFTACNQVAKSFWQQRSYKPFSISARKFI